MSKPYREEVAETALRMARSRRMRLDAKRILSATGPKCEEVEILRAKRDLSAARIEWRSASSKLWRLAEKVPS
jgi:hypothetical protein